MMRSSSTMFLFILFLQLFSAFKADSSVQCVNESTSRTVFKPSTDGVSGRYDVEWCTTVNPNVTKWELVLSYNLVKNESTCDSRAQNAHKHSDLTTEFVREDVNCTHMCFYTSLDMMFNGCFVLEMWLPQKSSQRHFLWKYINDTVPRQAYKQNTIYADAVNHEDHVAVHWYLDKVVATTYEMKLCENHTVAAGERKIIRDGEVFLPPPKEDRCEQINDRCVVKLPKRNEIICTLRHLNGSYYIELEHFAPWKNCGVFSKQGFSHYSFNVSDGRVWWSAPPPPAASPALAWTCGAVLVLCAVAAVAVFVWRSRLSRRFQQRVHSHWTCGDKPGIEPVVVPDNSVRAVLLLYAREGDLGEPLIRAVRDLLLQSRMKVLDLYSPAVVSVSAAAPAAWLRGQLQRRDTRVLLLQTPTLAAIYGDRASPLEAGADAALLHRRAKVVPAEPSPNDALLSLALRLLAEDVHTPTPYNKYFLATLESLETDTLPYIVPFRRYALPLDAARLVLDMQPGTALPADDALQLLRHEAHAFVQHVRDRPGYLRDHLLLLE